MRIPETFYHFTSTQHLAGVRQGGLAKGAIPFRMLPDGKITFMRGYQWLTLDGNWDQSWANPKLSPLPYRKNEYRLTIQIPNFAMKNLVSWLDYSQKVNPPSVTFLQSFRGHRHWWLFQGIIPFLWVVAVDHNPEPINLAHLNEVT